MSLPNDVPRPATILAIEDNPGDVDLLRQALADRCPELRFHALPTVNAALAFLADLENSGTRALPNLILLDLNLPAVNGAVGLSMIKATEDWCDIPAVVLSSSTRPREREECIRLGAMDYWVKPTDWSGFLSCAEDLGRLVKRLAQAATDRLVKP